MNKVRIAVAGIFAVGALAVPTAASASEVPPNFPGDTGTSCNAWHGAPGGFGPDSPYYTVAAPQDGVGGYDFGQRQGVNTGERNANYAESCNG